MLASFLLLSFQVLAPWIGTNAQASPPSPSAASAPPPFNITAISAMANASIFECWQFGPFAAAPAPGVTGASALRLGRATDLSYTVFPANTTGGLHHAPRVQFVVFMSGLARVTLPSPTGDTLAIRGGGRNSVIVAADTADVSGLGHRTDYPSGAATAVLQVPLLAGRLGMARHAVLHQGPCTEKEMSGF